ncbi:MAG TPA: hypothetical protein VMW66_01475 [Elusimicrobiales bacterium]|nr:hypothetical protein [Elusimicrobiales bacterium]
MDIQGKALFSGINVSDAMESRKTALLREIDSIDEERLFDTDMQSWIDYLFNKHKIQIPSIIENTLSCDSKDAPVDLSTVFGTKEFYNKIHRYAKGTKYIFSVAYEGDKEIFRYQPSKFDSNPPHATVAGGKLKIMCKDTTLDAVELKLFLSTELKKIKECLGILKSDISGFNDNLKKNIGARISIRKQQLEATDIAVQKMDLPLKKRKQKPLVRPVPAERKSIVIHHSDKYPDPNISDETYEDILSVISDMIMIEERSPHLFRSIDIETVRNYILINLNGQYENQTGGETFVGQRQTDILVRYKGKNVFVGECRFWKGIKSLKDDIEHLFKYVTWHDTKTAIIMLNKQKNTPAVLEKIPLIMKEFANFVEELPSEKEGRFEFVMSHPADKQKKILLTLVIFEVPQ